MKNIVKNIFTDGSNTDWDFAKVMGGLALLAFISISLHAYIHTPAIFDPLNWATGISIIIGAASGVSKLQDKSGAKE